MLFRCNPLDVLDRDEADLPMILALARVAQRDIESANKSRG